MALCLALSGCGECADDFECPGVQVCTDGRCARARCSQNQACPPAQVCRDNACVRARPVAPPQPDPVVAPTG